MSQSSGQRTFLRYSAADFPLYVFSLVAVGLLIVPIVAPLPLRLLIVGALAYMLCLFIMKHGVSLERHVLRDLLLGIVRYPGRILRSWWSVRLRVIQAIAVFAAALVLERVLTPHLAGSPLLLPFPWEGWVWGSFLAIAAFRLIILGAHLWKARHVREFLAQSPVKSGLRGAATGNHIIHAALTGCIAHLCLLAPAILFYSLTHPTRLREWLLIGGYLTWYLVVWVTKSYVPVEAGGDGNPFKRGAYTRLFSENHEIDHRSRFHFAVFHGHHHDAIPTAMIGAAGGTGFLESADRAVTWLDFLDSVTFTQVHWFMMCVGDMLAHQYVPGVFPYSRTNLKMKNHHVAHHFGSLYPLGRFDMHQVSTSDYRGGYDPDNARVRWYLEGVQRHERLTEDDRRQFVAGNFIARARAAIGAQVSAPIADLDLEVQQILGGIDQVSAAPNRLEALEGLWQRSHRLARQFPARAAATAVEGIALWQYANALRDSTSMGLSKEACRMLQKAVADDPKVLEGRACLALSEIFTSVPPFPKGFGDARKAQAYRGKALSIVPQEML